MNFFKKLFRFSTEQKPVYSLEAATQFVNTLESLSYFKYANKNNVTELKNELINSISKYGVLSSIYDDDTLMPQDYRYYSCDGENLYEQGGFLEKLQDFQPTFDKIGLKIKTSNHYEEWDSENRWLDHWITINDKEYIIFKNFKGNGWGEAALKLAQILNDQLELQGKDERLYLVNGGNDGDAVFLTNEQFVFINSFLKDKQWKPLKVTDWGKAMGVEPF